VTPPPLLPIGSLGEAREGRGYSVLPFGGFFTFVQNDVENARTRIIPRINSTKNYYTKNKNLSYVLTKKYFSCILSYKEFFLLHRGGFS
jgi:hypothetical protein